MRCPLCGTGVRYADKDRGAMLTKIGTLCPDCADADGDLHRA